MLFDYDALDKSTVDKLVHDIGNSLTDDNKSATEKQMLLMSMAWSTPYPFEFIAAFLIVEDLTLAAIVQKTSDENEIASVVKPALRATFSVLQICTSRLSLTAQAESKN